jgi:WD40 repeat protein
LWDEKSGRLLQTFRHQGRMRAGAVSQDGARVATSTNDDSIKLWDAATGKLIFSLPGHGDMNGASTAIRFAPDGRTLISFGNDYYLRIIDLSNGKAMKEFAIRPAGLSVADEGVPTYGERFYEFDTAVQLAYSAALSWDGALLCVIGRGKYHLFDTATGTERTVLDLPPDEIQVPAFSPDGVRLLTVGQRQYSKVQMKDGSMRSEPAKAAPLVCWDVKSGRKLWDIMLPGDFRHRLAFAPDGRTFAACNHSRDDTSTIEFRDAAAGKLLARWREPVGCRHVTFTPDGKRIIVAMADGTVLLYDAPAFVVSK